MKKLVGIRMSEATESRLTTLLKLYGTKAEVVAVAIDRLYRQEAKR